MKPVASGLERSWGSKPFEISSSKLRAHPPIVMQPRYHDQARATGSRKRADDLASRQIDARFARAPAPAEIGRRHLADRPIPRGSPGSKRDTSRALVNRTCRRSGFPWCAAAGRRDGTARHAARWCRCAADPRGRHKKKLRRWPPRKSPAIRANETRNDCSRGFVSPAASLPLRSPAGSRPRAQIPGRSSRRALPGRAGCRLFGSSERRAQSAHGPRASGNRSAQLRPPGGPTDNR